MGHFWYKIHNKSNAVKAVAWDVVVHQSLPMFHAHIFCNCTQPLTVSQREILKSREPCLQVSFSPLWPKWSEEDRFVYRKVLDCLEQRLGDISLFSSAAKVIAVG